MRHPVRAGMVWPPASGLREVLLFAVLAETGMRLGEALSLRHCDFHIGAEAPRLLMWPPVRIIRAGCAARRCWRGASSSVMTWRGYTRRRCGIWWTSVPSLPCRRWIAISCSSTWCMVRLFAPMRPENVYAKVRFNHQTLSGMLTQNWIAALAAPHTRHCPVVVGGGHTCGDAPPGSRRHSNDPIELWVGHRDAEMRTLGQ